MGAFLAMIGTVIQSGRSIGRASALLATVLTLAACGNDAGSDGLLGTVGKALAARVTGGDTPIDARQDLTAAQLARSPTSVLLVVVEKSDSGFTALPVASGSGTVQWIDATGGGLLTRDGVLVGTRGFGFDLIQADVAPLRAALRAGGGSDLLRIEHRLNGASEPVRERFFCALVPIGTETLTFFGTAHSTRVFEERCVGETRSFVNRYWRDGGGTMRQSAVDIGPETGVLTLSRLVD